MSTTITPQDVSITVKKKLDPYGEYRAFTTVAVDIKLHNRKVGDIEAMIIDRSKIPRNFFMSAMDGRSSDLQFVGVSLFEPKKGRTKVQSLAEEDPLSSTFMYIEKLHVDDDYKVNGASDVGALALHKLMNHPNLKKVKTAIYILDPSESITDAEREKERFDAKDDFVAMMTGSGVEDTDKQEQKKQQNKVRMRADATQFLRSGFFQEPAMVRSGEERFMVSSYSHWSKPLKAHQDVASVELAEPPVGRSEPTGKDLEIMNLVKTACAQANSFGSGQATMEAAKVAKLVVGITNLVSQGGSIAGSNALQCACANNSLSVVQAILEMEPTTINAPDSHEATALMVAANNVAGRRTNAGFPETAVIDELLRRGADKGVRDAKGLTAYGHYKKQIKDYDVMMHALTGGAVSRDSTQDPLVRAFEARLLPPGGPTSADMVGGETDGFVQYSDDDEGTTRKKKKART